MTSNLRTDTRQDRSYLPRIVVKVLDYQNSQCCEVPEADYFPPRNKFIPGELLLQHFPGICIKKLFTSIEPERIKGWVRKARNLDPIFQPPDFQNYFAIDCPFEIQLDALLNRVLTIPSVENAYIEYGPDFPPYSGSWKDMVSMNQGYLNAAPEGIDAKYAWQFSGGDGKGKVRFIDLEKGWILHHEAIQVGSLPDTGMNQGSYANHGAGVLGIIMMQQNDMGGMGITPKAKGYIMSQWRPDGSHNTADAVMASIAHLHFGDILLLEAQTTDTTENKNLWPVEIRQAIFSTIRLATALGIIVIEAGGNGNLQLNMGKDLDEFESAGKKMLNPTSVDFRDSGAILVAASSHFSPHTRMTYSNYGNRVNCYACGEGVLTAGNCQSHSEYDAHSYTLKFGGTSCATAIIAGAAIAVQSLMEANHHCRLSPVQMRQILSDDAYGSPSMDGRHTDKIGVMPDLKKIIDHALHFESPGI
jgi:Subtilase family